MSLDEDDYPPFPRRQGQLVRLLRSIDFKELPVFDPTKTFWPRVIDRISKDDVCVVISVDVDEQATIITPNGIRGIISANLLEVV